MKHRGILFSQHLGQFRGNEQIYLRQKVANYNPCFHLNGLYVKQAQYTWHQIIKTTWSITHAKDNHTVSWVHSFILITTSLLDVSQFFTISIGQQYQNKANG